ncbi:MAG: hypothetical protein NTW21_44800 [Verrucomicrobia bacterium]|nr:hypothetical protein [Verrucomicrobiota bacterium]
MAKLTITQEWGDEKRVCAEVGITRTPLYNLRKANAIRSLSLKIGGAKYGKRLYHLPSIREFLAKLEREQLEGERAAK